VSYFLTAAISCLSAIQYFGVVVPAVLPSVLWITIGVLILLGILNWIGISESAKVSLVAALIAFGSDLALLWTVFSHLSLGQVFSLFLAVFGRDKLTPTSVLVGFAGAFLAFSGLESISQLSPVMKTPRKKVIGVALFLVVLTIGVTSPLLTMLSTLLQPKQAADEVLSTQLISLLGGLSASLILVFASNTAIIGAYHVFLALSRMDFFPSFLLKRNRFRDTPHWSIALATGIPIAILLLVQGQINSLGALYAFGLLGAFTLTCLGLDLIRYRERASATHAQSSGEIHENGHAAFASVPHASLLTDQETVSANGQKATEIPTPGMSMNLSGLRSIIGNVWWELDFWLGVLTTALLGMGVASVNYMRRGRPPVAVSQLGSRLPDSVLAVLISGDAQNTQVIETAIGNADGKPIVFLYLGEYRADHAPQPFEIVDPYLYDVSAREAFVKAERLARKAKLPCRFVYRQRENTETSAIWKRLQPSDVILSAKTATQVDDINPDRIRYELTPNGKIAHLLKHW